MSRYIVFNEKHFVCQNTEEFQEKRIRGKTSHLLRFV